MRPTVDHACDSWTHVAWSTVSYARGREPIVARQCHMASLDERHVSRPGLPNPDQLSP
jgi:hypothetical protein